jgi:FMN phosphatase YigB (HAD superfamily)
MKEFCDNWTLNKDTVKIVKSVKTAGYKIAAISDTIQPHVEYMKRKGWYEPFLILILSSEVGMKKPEVGIYKLALKKLRVKASESIFIDDKEKNLVTAEKLGMKTILFKDAKQLRKELLNFGVKIQN